MAKKTAKKKSARKPNAAFMKAMTPSPALAEVVGANDPAHESPRALGVITRTGSGPKNNR